VAVTISKLFLVAVVAMLLTSSGEDGPTLTAGEQTATQTAAARTIDIADNDQNVTVFGEDPMNLATEVGDQLGLAVAATGDFNADGIMDILIGANGADGPGNERDHCGEAYVVFGEPGLPAQIDVAGAAGLPQPDIRIYAEEVGLPSALGWGVGDNLGEVITTGDVNGDGFDDIIIASTLADGPENSRPDTGEVYIIFGKSEDDWDNMRPSPNAPVIFDVKGVAGPKPDVVILGADKEDVLGCGLATGDVDGDGIADLLTGACYADGPENGRTDAGEAYAFLGRSAEAWQDISPIDLRTSPTLADIVFYGADAGDYLGSAMASDRDANGDGLDDILIGARGADGIGNAKPDAGEVHLFLGQDYASWGALTPVDLSITNADVTIYGGDAGDSLSSFVGLWMGHVNGDAIGDLLIGAPSAAGPGNGRPGSGEAYVIFGRLAWPGTIDLSTTPADVTIHGADPDDWLGSSIASGDVNDDGTADILIGAPGGDGPGNGRLVPAASAYWAAGEAYVVLGRAFSTEMTIDLATPGSAQITIYGAEIYDRLGDAISSGDVNGDQVDDVLVGAAYAYGPMNARPEAGEAYVVFGP
jgi:hypothetical protein